MAGSPEEALERPPFPIWKLLLRPEWGPLTKFALDADPGRLLMCGIQGVSDSDTPNCWAKAHGVRMTRDELTGERGGEGSSGSGQAADGPRARGASAACVQDGSESNLTRKEPALSPSPSLRGF